MRELPLLILGVVLLVLAPVRAGASPVRWWLLRYRLTRLLGAVVAAVVLIAVLTHLAAATGRTGHPSAPMPSGSRQGGYPARLPGETTLVAADPRARAASGVPARARRVAA